VALAERHNARVWVAPMSGRCGFPEDHRLFAGFLPAMRERIVERLAGHDLVFALGAPAFTYHVEGRGPHVPEGASLVQLIDDPATAAWTPQGLSVVGSIRLGLLDLLARAAPRPRVTPAPRQPIARATPPAAGERMSVAFALQTLADLRAPDSIVVEEAPSARPVMQAHLPILRPETFYTMDSGGLGWGLPAAVGVALGKPGARVIALVGDGSAMYSIQALWTAAQRKLPLTVVVINNSGYGAMRSFSQVMQVRNVPGLELPGIDFVKLAEGMGCHAVRVTKSSALAGAIKHGLSHEGTSLIEVMVDSAVPLLYTKKD
jgi:benzoylformate decarboxylase